MPRVRGRPRCCMAPVLRVFAYWKAESAVSVCGGPHVTYGPEMDDNAFLALGQA